MKKYSVLILMLFCMIGFFAQDSIQLKYKEFLQIVLEHHPIAKKAEATQLEGEAKEKAARGNFDPKINGGINQKYYSEKQYYSYLHGGLKVPLWYGLDLNADYNLNQGYFLNSENYTGQQGLYQAGVSINLAKGLFFDQRRAAVRLGETYRKGTEIERKRIINKLTYEASISYWQWWKAYRTKEIINSSLQKAKARYLFIKQGIAYGERPEIDSIKAIIQIQEREVMLLEAEMNLKNKRLELGVYLWQDGMIPLVVDSLVYPEQNDIRDKQVIDIKMSGVDSLVFAHPDYLSSENKIVEKEIELRLKKEYQKPELALKYNVISASSDVEEFDVGNYNWGMAFSYPIFTRKERGEVKMAKAKLQISEYEFLDKEQKIRAKLSAALNTFDYSQKQWDQQTNNVVNYEQLLTMENKLFKIGESSLFLVNQRDIAYLEAQIKNVETSYKVKHAELNFRYLALLWN